MEDPNNKKTNENPLENVDITISFEEEFFLEEMEKDYYDIDKFEEENRDVGLSL